MLTDESEQKRIRSNDQQENRGRASFRSRSPIQERTDRPAQTPQHEAEATVGIQTDGDFSGGVQLTLQLHRAAEGSHRVVGHLQANTHAAGEKVEVPSPDRDRETALT